MIGANFPSSIASAKELVASFTLAQLSLSRLPPSALPAVFLVALAVLVLLANYRRPINRMWTLGLFLLGLWQGSIALAFWQPSHLYARFAVFFGGCSIYAVGLLKDTIVAPWRSLWSHLKRTRFQLILLPIYCLSFSPWWSLPTPLSKNFLAHVIVFWTLDAISFVWSSALLIQSGRLVLSREVSGIPRSELIALVVLIASGFMTYAGNFVLGWILNVPHASWRAPSIFLGGLSLVTVLLVRNEIFDIRDFRKGFVVFSARALVYFVIAFLCAAFASAFRQMSLSFGLFFGLALVPALALAPIFDRKLRQLVDRQFTSQDFLDAESAAKALAETIKHPSELHASFVKVLQRWSDGSERVFLSDGFSMLPWPQEPIPDGLIRHLSEHKWTTPEILDRQGSRPGELSYMLRNQVAAIVAFIAHSGERLLVAFETRSSQRPFASRSLREAHELLGVMQLGLSFAKVSQKLLGTERLNFYAQYAPHFAHELRNGLYLQNQLLRAISEGRIADVLPSDAEAGLLQIRQVDQLCSHFLSVRTLYDRPIDAMDFRNALLKIIDVKLLHLLKRNEVSLETSINTPPGLRAIGNPDLLEMAVDNIISNAVEALVSAEKPRRIQLLANTHLEKLHISISDNGPGLPTERKHDPFTPGSSGKNSGMGLGLAIARDCIESMGGTVGLRSSDAQGTCFEITLNCLSSV